MSAESHDRWTVHESGPADAEHAALLLPGGLCTAAFYDDVLADPQLADSRIRLAAATVPGFGGRNRSTISGSRAMRRRRPSSPPTWAAMSW